MNRSSVPEPASRLARQLGTFDAVVIGMGAMIGAGIFAVIGPAVAVAGSAALLALLLAGVLAYCNAAASAQLAAVYPESDRKSTRLNSSHVATSYALFC